jgi:hypothetical protein
MKESFYFFCIIMMPLLLIAQTPINITGADMPKAGQAFILANDTVTNVALGTPGVTQQTWNFASLTNHYFKAAVYDSTALTSFAAQYPQSNIYTLGPAEFFGALYGGAPVYAGFDGYTFWQSDNDGLRVIGWNAIEGPFAGKSVHTAPAELLLPANNFTGGNTMNDTSRWDLFLGDNPADVDTSWITTRTKTFTGDAWGDLTTPFGYFSDVVRIHEYVTQVDSVVATLNSITVYEMEVRRVTSNNYIYMAKNIGYPIATVHTDINNNVQDVEYIIDTTCAVYSKIMGAIADSSGNLITNGTVYLYQYINAITPLQIVDSTVINANGFYTFINVSYGNYIISAEADITFCPTCIPTYNGNVNYWFNGSPLNTLCVDSFLVNILLTQLPNMVGNAILNGLIQYGLGGPKTNGFPVTGAKVFLEKNAGELAAFTVSDVNGNYAFNNVEPGNYTITVDVPGLPMKSTHQVSVSTSDTLFENLDFTIDTTTSSGGVYAEHSLSVKTISSSLPVAVYPNPSSGTVMLLAENVNALQIQLFNALGQLVYSDEIISNDNRIHRTLQLEHLPAGIYTLHMMSDNNRIHKKLMLQ